MDVLLTDSLLREFLDTKANPQKLAECLSLCGPSIEKITKEGPETVYHIEVTTNRVDAASAYGIAKEAVAILPQFGLTAKLVKPALSPSASKKELDIAITIDPKLCERFTAVKLTDIEVSDSPQFIKNRLTAMGQRPLNNVIDITNYAMFALGIPMHAFDYDKLGKTIIVREAKKHEKFVTLDDKSHTAEGGEVVFDNGAGEIIDLPGVMGTKNSMVTSATKSILLVLEHIDHHKVRSASLKHEERTNAAILNEKNPDPNEIDSALQFALFLFEKYAKGHVASKVFNWYPKPRTEHTIRVNKDEIDTMLGVSLSKKDISNILESLQFKTKWNEAAITVVVPTSRVQDVTIPEDIIEEIARIYGYFRLPSVIPEGFVNEARNKQFDFEMKIKRLLAGWGGNEVYTLSLVSKAMAGEKAMKLKNPLGGDGEYMRTELTASLVEATKVNKHESLPFHLFEISNVYIPQNKKLPVEDTHLAGIFVNTDYRHAKGVIEALFEVLNIKKIEPKLMRLGKNFVYEYRVEDLLSAHAEHTKYRAIPLFPPQIEDFTLLTNDTKIGEVISVIKSTHEHISAVQFIGNFENKASFRVTYQDPNKTLTDSEVSKIRAEILKNLQSTLDVVEA